jgi:spermidine/putrescine transport system substrate-binding protein
MQIDRRLFLQGAAYAGLSAALGACANPFAPAAVDRARLAQQIKLFHWRDYIAPDVLEAFRKEYGVTVLLDTASSNQQIQQTIAATADHGYDLITITDYTVATMSAASLLQKIPDTASRLGVISTTHRGLYYDPRNEYSIPYFWGTTGVLYDPARVSNPITSWMQLLTPPERLIGRVGMLDDARETLAVALRTLNHPGSTADRAQLEAARQVLLRQRRDVANYDSSAVNSQRVQEGELIVAMTRTQHAISAIQQNPGLRYALPDAVSTIWQDSLCIPVGAPSAYTAGVFIDFVLRPEIAALNASAIGAATPNAEVLRRKLLDAAVLNDALIYPDVSVSGDRFEWLLPLTLETNTRYQAIFDEVKAG